MSSAASPHRPMPRWAQPLRGMLHRTRFAVLRVRSLGRLHASATPITASGVKILSSANVRLGRRVALGRRMYVETDLEVGDDVLFSGNVAVVGNVHPLDTTETVFASDHSGSAQVVRLDGDNLVGYGAVLIGPCHLKRGAVVGAGAVATGVLEEDTIYVGVPARPLRTRRR